MRVMKWGNDGCEQFSNSKVDNFAGKTRVTGDANDHDNRRSKLNSKIRGIKVKSKTCQKFSRKIKSEVRRLTK